MTRAAPPAAFLTQPHAAHGTIQMPMRETALDPELAAFIGSSEELPVTDPTDERDDDDDHGPTPRYLTRRGARARIPRTDAERDAPLHSKPVPTMDTAALLARMLPEQRARWEETHARMFPDATSLARLLELHPPASTRPQGAHMYPAEHAAKLAADGVAEPADGPGPVPCVPFNVFEEKKTSTHRSGGRQRFILWPWWLNAAADAAGYRAQVDLHAQARYLPAVMRECASCRDLAAGFYQLALPEHARALFRYQDDTGRWWQLTRVPMGLSGAVELVHGLMSVAAGHPEWCLPQYAARDVETHVWIDNARWSGDRAAVQRAASQFDELARRARLTLNSDDAVDLGVQYTFLGVAYDHQGRTVRAGDKTAGKIADFARSLDGPVSAAAVESGVARVLCASQIAGEHPGAYYFAVKWARRVINKLARGVYRPDSIVTVPPSVRAALLTWAGRAVRARTPPLLEAEVVRADRLGYG